MVSAHRFLILLGIGFLFALCAGMVSRKLLSRSFAFSAYVAAATTFTTLIFLFPEYYTPEAYTVKQGIYDSLLFGLSLEVAIRAFGAFRGVANQVRILLAAAVALSTAVIFVMTPNNVGYSDMVRYQPGITTGGIWCLTFVALLVVWYQIPIPRFTKAIILGYVPYLVIFVVYEDLIGRLGWGAIRGLNLVNGLAYDTVAAYWAYAAWRKDS